MGRLVKRRDLEGPVHNAILAYLTAVLPDAIVHHARNEINMRSKRVALELAEARAKGAVKGFPDFLVIPDGHPTIFLEVKAGRNTADPTQKDLHAKIHSLGHHVAVVRSVDEVREFLARLGIKTKEKQ